MSPWESRVKISHLAASLRKKVNKGRNEGWTHKMLSQPSRDRLHMGRCDSKDSVECRSRLFLVNAAFVHPPRLKLDQIITI